jgi:hypothetical protein
MMSRQKLRKELRAIYKQYSLVERERDKYKDLADQLLVRGHEILREKRRLVRRLDGVFSLALWSAFLGLFIMVASAFAVSIYGDFIPHVYEFIAGVGMGMFLLACFLMEYDARLAHNHTGEDQE